ncbi:MAG TPA: hypothetical protein VN982_10835 [Candidatus Dormibacteraeota bacterium]|nr:hypothetical protein [Candidatus Dormibacteraeota bacterium]
MSPPTGALPAEEPSAQWDTLLRQEIEKTPDLVKRFVLTLRASKLTFARRTLCPFLRPFFLTPEDEHRVRVVAETIAKIGERVAVAALENDALLEQFHLREEEKRLARLPVGTGPASTASRLDSFLLPDSLKFAEYNAESPAGAGYGELLGEIFRELPMMREFSRTMEVHSYTLTAKLLDALVATYLEWGGKSKRPQIAIVDWREVPTWTEFQILKARFEKMGVPTVLADPKELRFDGNKLTVRGKKIDLVYRRVLMNDIIARPAECQALLAAYSAGIVCVANTFRCKIPHVKTFFAVLTEEGNASLFSGRERELIARHIPWTRVVADVSTQFHGTTIGLLDHVRKHREDFVLKPSDEYGGTGVTLGWETDESAWDAAIQNALKNTGAKGCWIVQERIPVRREKFPRIGPGGKISFQETLVDFAPYLYRGKMAGFLTRLSATGLANVTSGGGQIPAFRVSSRKP